MKKGLILLSVSLLLISFVSASNLVLNSSYLLDDAYVDSNVGNRNFGLNTELKLQRNPYQRNYLKFDISYLPRNYSIDHSSVCLYLHNDQASQTISVNHVYVNSWREGSLNNADASGQTYKTNITWNNQPCGTGLDNASACNLTAESSITNDGSFSGTWQCWNVTNAVFREYASSNKNVSLVLHTEDFGNGDFFYSKEYSNSLFHPFLNITLSPIVFEAYVNASFDSSVEGWGITHFKNISSALEMVQEGGRVYVADGTYNERLIIGKSVGLVGAGWESTTINGGGSGHVITINSNNVNVSGFKVIRAGTNWGNAGIFFNSGGYSVIENNYIGGNRVGISLSTISPGNIFRTNYIVNSSQAGIYSNYWDTQNNKIYNNYFNNSVNLNIVSSPPNFAIFNITKTPGTNILGGDYIGGNFWNNYTGTNRGDGFGNTPYNVQGSYYDYLPLVDYTEPPSFSNFVSSPLTNSFYSPGQTYKFNVTINSLVSLTDVGIEFDGVNYSVSNVSNVYTFSISDLPAGSYAYSWWAEDIAGGFNSSGVNGYVIQKANPNLQLLNFNGWTITYGKEVTFSCSALTEPTLFVNDVEVINPISEVFGVGSYNIKCNVSESQNYTEGESQGNLVVNKAQSNVSLIFDKSSPQTYGEEITPFCSLIEGVGEAKLFLNGEEISSGDGLVLGGGNWSFNCSYSGNQNFTSFSLVREYVIDKAEGDVNLFLNGEQNNLSIEYPQSYNVTAMTSYGQISLFRNGEDITTLNGLLIPSEKEFELYNITAISSGNQNYSSSTKTFWLNVSYDNVPPVIEIYSPQEGSNYGDNSSILLNFSVYDDNLDSCWYSLNGDENVSLPNCENTFFEFDDGSYTLSVFANDTLENIGLSTSSFTVLVGSPTLSLNSPIGIYLNNQNVVFRYFVRGFELDSCILFGDFSGEFEEVIVDNNLENDAINTFEVFVEDGTYNWGVSCNNSAGNLVYAGNKTFHVDTIAPKLVLNEPKGIKNSRTNIPLNFSITDASPTVCSFNVYRGVNPEILNTTINCLNPPSFDVTVDADFVLNLFVRDYVGNFNSTSSTFSVSTTSTPQPPSSGSGGGGGGGGGGGSVSITTRESISLESISNLVLNPGENRRIILKARNTGTGFLGKCRVNAEGEYASWVSESETRDLTVGEPYDFVFNLAVPKEVKAGVYNFDLNLKCVEASQSTSFSVEVIEKKIDFEILSYSRERDFLKINYSLTELFGVEQNAEIQFVILDDSREKIGEIQETRFVGPNEFLVFETLIPIDKDVSGTINLLININSEIYSTFIQESIVVGSPISGFAIFEGNIITENLVSVVILIIFFLFAVFLFVRIMHLRKKHRIHQRALFHVTKKPKLRRK